MHFHLIYKIQIYIYIKEGAKFPESTRLVMRSS